MHCESQAVSNWRECLVCETLFALADPSRSSDQGARSMPRFYFHVTRLASSIPDIEGTELLDLAEARAEAVRDARALMSCAILEGRDISGRSIEICNEAGDVLIRMPFREAFSSEE
jgi:hypothetical protein